LGEALKVVQAPLGVLFLAGLVGRWITLSAAARAAEMRDGFADPVVRAAHLYERGKTVTVLVLMISKPF
jgi:hypothetical protein